MSTTLVSPIGLAAVMLYAGHEILAVDATVSRDVKVTFTEIPKFDLDDYRKEWNAGTLAITDARRYQEAFSQLGAIAKKARSNPDGQWFSADYEWLQRG